MVQLTRGCHPLLQLRRSVCCLDLDLRSVVDVACSFVCVRARVRVHGHECVRAHARVCMHPDWYRMNMHVLLHSNASVGVRSHAWVYEDRL